MEQSSVHLGRALDRYEATAGHVHRSFFAQDPRAICLVRLALTSLWRDDLEGSLELVDQALDFSDEIDHPTSRCYVLTYAAIHSIELDHLDVARSRVDEVIALATEHRLDTYLRLVECCRPWLDTVDGDHAAFDRLVDIAASGTEGELANLHYTFFQSLVGRAALHTGDLDAGIDAVRAGLDWGRSHDQRYADALLRRIEGELLARKGRDDDAATAFGAAIETADRQGASRLARQARETAGRLGIGVGTLPERDGWDGDPTTRSVEER